jgi:hypothetical protein
LGTLKLTFLSFDAGALEHCAEVQADAKKALARDTQLAPGVGAFEPI